MPCWESQLVKFLLVVALGEVLTKARALGDEVTAVLNRGKDGFKDYGPGWLFLLHQSTYRRKMTNLELKLKAQVPARKPENFCHFLCYHHSVSFAYSQKQMM